ncbi:hypothetical protein GCM10010381_69710 [Streptomyces xantholiticus]|nr:hypothetical protein GCM10010381_69710 [Streptomyces xantholiticus]
MGKRRQQAYAAAAPRSVEDPHSGPRAERNIAPVSMSRTVGRGDLDDKVTAAADVPVTDPGENGLHTGQDCRSRLDPSHRGDRVTPSPSHDPATGSSFLAPT